MAGIILLPLQFPTALHLYVRSSPQRGYTVIPLVLFVAAVSLCWTPGWMGGCTASDPSLQLLLWDLASGTHRRVGFRSGSGVVCVLLWHLVASFPCALDPGVKGGRSDSRGGWVSAQLLSEHVMLPHHWALAAGWAHVLLWGYLQLWIITMRFGCIIPSFS